MNFSTEHTVWGSLTLTQIHVGCAYSDIPLSASYFGMHDCAYSKEAITACLHGRGFSCFKRYTVVKVELSDQR